MLIGLENMQTWKLKSNTVAAFKSTISNVLCNAISNCMETERGKCLRGSKLCIFEKVYSFVYASNELFS